MSKEDCDPPFNENAINSTFVKIEPLEMSSLNNDDIDSYSNEAIETKEAIGINYLTSNPDSENSWQDTKIKVEVNDNDFQELVDEIDAGFDDDDPLKAHTEDSERTSFQLTEELIIKEEKEEQFQGGHDKLDDDNKSLETNFQCKICNKTYGRLSTLKNHMLIHSAQMKIPIEKRNRSENFTSVEKFKLIRLLNSNKILLVLDKRTDAVSIKKKNLAWQLLAEEFNSSNITERNISSLKKVWNKLKFDSRIYKKENFANTEKKDPLLDAVLDLLGQEIVEVEEIQIQNLDSLEVNTSNFATYTEKSTNQVNEPIYPTSKPIYPTSEPTYPSFEPNYSSSQPIYPTSEPIYSSSKPNYPTSEPINPSSEPIYPTSKSNYPIPQSYPTSEPIYPTSKPNYPSSQPIYPTSKPIYPTSDTIYPTSEPIYPTSKPIYPTSDTIYPTSKPIYPTSERINPSSESIYPTSKPNYPIPQPYTTSEPFYPTSKPIYPTSESINPSSEPINRTSKPNYPNSERINPSSKLYYPTSKPNYPTSEPFNPTSEPFNPTSEPNYPTSERINPSSKPIYPTSESTNTISELKTVNFHTLHLINDEFASSSTPVTKVCAKSTTSSQSNLTNVNLASFSKKKIPSKTTKEDLILTKTKLRTEELKRKLLEKEIEVIGERKEYEKKLFAKRLEQDAEIHKLKKLKLMNDIELQQVIFNKIQNNEVVDSKTVDLFFGDFVELLF